MAKKDNKRKPEPKKEPAPVQNAPVEQTAQPDAITREDQLILQIVVKNLENANLKAQLAQLQAEKATKEREEAQTKFKEIQLQVNNKYALDPSKDRIALDTGTITRG